MFRHSWMLPRLRKNLIRALKKDDFWYFVLFIDALAQFVIATAIPGFAKAILEPFQSPEANLFRILAIVAGTVMFAALPLLIGLFGPLFGIKRVYWTYPETWVSPLPINHPLCLQRFIAWMLVCRTCSLMLGSLVNHELFRIAVFQAALAACCIVVVLVTALSVKMRHGVRDTK